MNFQEGMRRVGLTVGFLGALGVAYAAFWPFSEFAAERHRQDEFKSLLRLPITQKIGLDIAKDKVPNAVIDIQGHPEGIYQIRTDTKGAIDSFTMEDGRAVTKTEAPSWLWYLLYPIIVAAGFFLPWGTVRLLTWIVSGFVGSPA